MLNKYDRLHEELIQTKKSMKIAEKLAFNDFEPQIKEAEDRATEFVEKLQKYEAQIEALNDADKDLTFEIKTTIGRRKGEMDARKHRVYKKHRYEEQLDKIEFTKDEIERQEYELEQVRQELGLEGPGDECSSVAYT